MTDSPHAPARARAPGHSPLLSTYRVQLSKDFTLTDALGIVDYLDTLGISHLYCSPILEARPGSTHGYDVVNPTRINPEIGTVDDLRALAGALHGRGMGMLLDIVPNHMGNGPHNPFWEDVLAHGEQSRYARWFDVDWDVADHRIVLPVLDDELDALIEGDKFALDVTGKAPRLTHGKSSWPLDPTTLPEELQLVHFDPTSVADPSIFVHGDAGRRERLRKLLHAQHYSLVPWRRASSEINYRRFFDVNDLVALRQEDPAVFAETHAFVLSLVEEGVIDGLRVDHVDGLMDPLGYLTRLRHEVERLRPVAPETRAAGARNGDAGRRAQDAGAFPILVEKILSPGETLRDSWPVEGTTGYEFLNDLEDIFIEPRGYAAVERAYRRTRRLTKGDFRDVAYEGKVKILGAALRADVLRLGRELTSVLAAGGGAPPMSEIEPGIVQFIAALPVYRTYVDGCAKTPHPDDVVVVERAVEEARRRVSAAPVIKVVELIADVVLGRENERHPLPSLEARLPFIQRLQQTTGPATAKGIEDTALYVYVPLVSRNEVGGAPDRPLDDAVGRFHGANAIRARLWPSALNCTNTHDTKRSADVRARLDVISERATDWQRNVSRWRRLNRRHRTFVKGRLAPDTNSEYLLYQTLVGIWPTPRPGRRGDDLPDRAWREKAKERLGQYMLKAVREAKTRTNWTDPDAEYEKALTHFIAAVLEPAEDAPFLTDVARFVADVAPLGEMNALARQLLHLTSPGVPDTYRGDEPWFYALVDPDNRRPVDYEVRRRLVREDERAGGTAEARDAGTKSGSATESRRAEETVATPGDPISADAKLHLLRRALHSRRAHPLLFSLGSYRPLEVRGERANHVVAFLRAHGGDQAIIVAPRLLASIVDRDSGSIEWGDSEIVLPEEVSGRCFRSPIDGEELAFRDGASTVMVSEVLRSHPLALLLSSERGA